MNSRKLHLAVVSAIASVAFISATSAQATISTAQVEAALCIHSGWHYTHRWVRGERADYFLWGHAYWRTYDVPDYLAGGSGEGEWGGVVGSLYGGGLSFTVGTWNRAGAPYARSTYDIARASPKEQIRRLLVIVRQDGGSYREWPQTSRACGLPT